ncbi:MAG: TFIIB-type zinc ribbon-containing protein [Nitrospirota bacterium]
MKKTSNNEEEYFARSEYDRLKKIEAAKQELLAGDERRKAQELHYMHCPKCGMSLIEIEYKSIWVDKCSGCEGIWLDAGEMESVAQLDKGGLDRLFDVFRK